MRAAVFRRIRQVMMLAVAGALAGCVTPARYGGPLVVRNQHPAQLVVQRLEPTSARTIEPGQARVDLALSYTSLFLRGLSATDTFVMDGEILHTVLGARIGLTDTIDFRFAIPTIHSTGGFLDHTVEQWHDLLDTPESGRKNFPEDLWSVTATRNGQTVYSLDETTLALMDVPLELMWQVVQPTEQNPYALALRGGLELPTGDANDGTGNGGFDFSLGVVGEILMGPIGMNAHAEYTWAHTPDRAKAAGVDFGDVASGGVGLELGLTEDTVALLQLELEQSVLRNLNNVNTDSSQLMLWVGFRTQWTESLASEIAFAEDMNREIGPDFTAFLGFRLDVGPSRGGEVGK